MTRPLRSAALGALAWIALALPASAQRSFDDVTLKATHVAGSVYMIEGAGGNIGVSVGPDGILIVDDQFAPLADKIRAALRGLGEGKLRFVLNTHFHGDHVGGNPIFGREATIIAHENVRRRLVAPPASAGPGAEREPMPPEGLPVVTFGNALSVHFNGEEIRVLHVPNGHTDGDSVIFFTGSNVVHMGDQMFGGRFPFVDLDGGGDVEGYTMNVARVIGHLAGKSGVRIIPGHGPLATVDDLRTFQRMLEETTALVRERMDAGKDLAAIQAEGLPETWASWSWNFVDAKRWIETIHLSLSRKPSPPGR